MNSYPAIAFSMILLIPLIWNLPISVITSELGLSMPTNEGIFVWIHFAFVYFFIFHTLIIYKLQVFFYNFFFFIIFFFLQKISVSSCVSFVLIFNYFQMADKTYFASGIFLYIFFFLINIFFNFFIF